MLFMQSKMAAAHHFAGKNFSIFYQFLKNVTKILLITYNFNITYLKQKIILFLKNTPQYARVLYTGSNEKVKRLW